MSDIRRKKLRLWKQDPHCYWCGMETVIVDDPKIKQPPFNLATIDHVRSRWSADRGSDNKESTVLSCLLCNNQRNEVEMRRVPPWEMRARSGRYPRWLRELERVFDSGLGLDSRYS